MLFGIDLDGTYSRAPDLFREMVTLIRRHGHEAICVTGRTPETRPEVEELLDGQLDLIMTSHKWKKEAAARHGYHVDIWIDDECTEITPAPDAPWKHVSQTETD